MGAGCHLASHSCCQKPALFPAQQHPAPSSCHLLFPSSQNPWWGEHSWGKVASCFSTPLKKKTLTGTGVEGRLCPHRSPALRPRDLTIDGSSSRFLWPGCPTSSDNMDAQADREKYCRQMCLWGLVLETSLWPHSEDSVDIPWHLDDLQSLKSVCTSPSRLCLLPTLWRTAPDFLPRKLTLSRPCG